jgi:ATP-binding cassette, subfamily G (WHITE), member 2, PDR
MAKSKGKILIFRRSHFVSKKSVRQMTEANDEEALGLEKATVVQSAATDEAHPMSHEGQIFQWQDVCYNIKNKGVTRRILDHVDGWVQPGTLTALMVRL